MRGLRGGLRPGLRGPLRGFGAGGGWTIGTTSPVLWTRAGVHVTSAGSPAVASAWGDVRDDVAYTWAESEAEHRPVVGTDARGPYLGFSDATYKRMSCHALGSLGGGTAVTIAIACEISGPPPPGATTKGLVEFTNSSTGLPLRLARYASADRVRFERYNNASAYAYIDAASPAPFVGVLVARYTGAALKLRANGTALSDAAASGALTTDRLWLGCLTGASYFLTGLIREVVIWDRALTDPEAVTVDAHLRALWSY